MIAALALGLFSFLGSLHPSNRCSRGDRSHASRRTGTMRGNVFRCRVGKACKGIQLTMIRMHDRDLLDHRIGDRIVETYTNMQRAGELLSEPSLRDCYSLFRSRFGPSELSKLDGEQLLNEMHASGGDSLAYWLEFKNDDEFSGEFGSIAEGSALKFGIYKRRETDEWTTGSPQNQRPLRLDEAIEIAHDQRDQLLAGCEGY